MPLTITSEIVRPARSSTVVKVIFAIDQAIKEGILEVVEKDVGSFSKTIARKTGDMREEFEKALTKILDGAGSLLHRGKTTISWSNIESRVVAALDYAIHHFRGRGYYINPTVEGTYPMRERRFKAHARPAIIRRIIANLKGLGVTDKAEFEVN